MTYFTDLNTYLHQSSLLIQAYPTSRITTKYSLPRKPSTTSKSTPAQAQAQAQTEPTAMPQKEKREPSATLTLKTYHPESGICLKYRTDKAQEVSRLISGLGRLAKGEIIDLPSAVGPDKMDVDEPVAVAEKVENVSSQIQPPQPQPQQQQQGGGGGKKKKKGKK